MKCCICLFAVVVFLTSCGQVFEGRNANYIAKSEIKVTAVCVEKSNEVEKPTRHHKHPRTELGDMIGAWILVLMPILTLLAGVFIVWKTYRIKVP